VHERQVLAGSDLLQNIRSVVFNPFFNDFSSLDKDDVHVGYHNSLSSRGDTLIFTSVSAIPCYAIGDLAILSDLVFHNCLDVGESSEKHRFISFL
jgi:hypothetical protein